MLTPQQGPPATALKHSARLARPRDAGTILIPINNNSSGRQQSARACSR